MQNRDISLDLVRGLSALAVLASHLRAFLFRDLGELTSPDLFTKIFYVATGFGHQAVMVFFVLSGYFVGGGICRAFLGSGFSWRRYLVARLSRLYVVLVPALVLTFCCDLTGRHLRPDVYQGSRHEAYSSGPEAGQAISLSFETAACNLLFLQTILVPVFGSNSPLWSLANEFWYYLLFPISVLAALSWRSPVRAALLFLLFGLLLFWLPRPLAVQGLIWLFGVAVWLVRHRFLSPEFRGGGLCSTLSFGGFIASLLLSRTGLATSADFLIGASFAVWLVFLVGSLRKYQASLLGSLSRGLSEISFTLYVIHFPLLFLLLATRFEGEQLRPGFLGFSIYTAVFLSILAVASMWWWLFERHTDQVRRRLERAFVAGQFG